MFADDVTNLKHMQRQNILVSCLAFKIMLLAPRIVRNLVFSCICVALYIFLCVICVALLLCSV